MMKLTMIAAALAVLTTAGFAQAQGMQGMDMKDHGSMRGMHMGKQADADAKGTGTVKKVDAEKRTVNLAHGPIEAIGWPAMVMDFQVAGGVDLSGVAAGQEVEFSLARNGNNYVVTSIAPRR